MGKKKDSLIILSSDNARVTSHVLMLALSYEMRVIYVVDDMSCIKGNANWAFGFISKKTLPSHFVKSIYAIINKNINWMGNLTFREIEVMNALIEGKSNRDISDEMFISQKTVSAHKMNALKKMGVSRLSFHTVTIFGAYKNIMQKKMFG